MSNRFKAKFSIKKGDSVVVITGDDKDVTKPRKVLELYPEESKLLVEGANSIKVFFSSVRTDVVHLHCCNSIWRLLAANVRF